MRSFKFLSFLIFENLQETLDTGDEDNILVRLSGFVGEDSGVMYADTAMNHEDEFEVKKATSANCFICIVFIKLGTWSSLDHRNPKGVSYLYFHKFLRE
jgi:hypothetical protein